MKPNGKFVFVDDDQGEHELFALSLKKLGYDNKIEYFSNGKEAFDFLLNTEDNLFIIFSDIHMPGMDGLEFKKSIETVPVLRAKAIPFIFHSSSSSSADIKRAYGLNIQGFLQKKSDITEAMDAFKKTIDYWLVNVHPKDIKNFFK